MQSKTKLKIINSETGATVPTRVGASILLNSLKKVMKRVCKRCQKQFKTTSARAKYCGNACRVADYRDGVKQNANK